ncbi:endoplasmic reticulum aminopeptidase 2-like isoform X3 [Tachypleus tridentatus]|uniref:endoplasmic reticulum aminopeptidase 2-like isoform X3 n=1 Tax=Tachypleus tridentatus TaxID=6853 RepID=UPI003FD3F989
MNEQGSSSSYHVPDDVAFLTGGDSGKAVLYGRSKHSTGQIQEITFSKEQACCIVGIVLMVMLMIALVAAFARPTVFCGDGYGNVTENSLLKNTASSGLLETGNKDFPWQEICLPPFVKPLHYSIFIHPNLTTFWNEGTVNITLEVLQATNFVVIHKKDLNITVQDLFTFSGEQIKIVKSLENTEHEQLYLEFETVMKPLVEYVLHIQFNRPLQETLEGFYISSYIPSDGQKRYLATTQFEPTAARSAFPCFDEPDMKATFTLQIVHEQDYDVYFNSDLNISLPYENGLILSVFNPTVRMSTYLVAFLLCDFSTIQGKTKSGIDVKVIVPKSQMSQSVFAMESCVKILEYYERFFDIPYPLTKLDMAAIPDFSAGAMENWGLVTYRMNAILHDSEESSSESQEWVAIVIAHELAHQWFGNLVTMKWWNDLWLNEGFATYVEFIGADFLKPDWQVKEQFIFFVTQRALQMDSLKSSHPITSDVKDPAEISANFDAISYKKGGALIQMLESFLGINTLQEGLTLYLNKYKYRNAETRDLWDSLTKVINDGLQINISYVMDTWTIQEGFPVILVSRMENMVYVHQKRFLLTPSRSDEVSEEDISPYGYEWDIPITYITDRDTKVQRFMLNTTTGTFSVKENVKWLKLNVNQTGFFRVAYEEKEWRTFIEVLHQNHEKLFCGDRASLLDDAFSLARNGMLNSSVPLDMTSYLQKEKSYVPWGTAFLHFNDLDFLLYETSVYSLFQSYVRKLLQPLVNYLGWKDEGTHMTKKLRSLALVEAIYFGHKKVLAEGKKLFDSWMNNGTWIPPNLEALCTLLESHKVVLKSGSICGNVTRSPLPLQRKN